MTNKMFENILVVVMMILALILITVIGSIPNNEIIFCLNYMLFFPFLVMFVEIDDIKH